MSKIALITGASRGIGKAVATGLAADGYQTVLIARDATELQAVAKEITENGAPEPLVIPLDVTDEAAVKAAVVQTITNFSRIDVLFNNAGIATYGGSDSPIAEFKQQVDVNIYGVLYFIYYITPIMKQQQSGYIINLSSKVALKNSKTLFAYAATKAAVRGMGMSLFEELLEYNVKVTTLFPSASNTEMSKTAIANAEKIPVSDYVTAVRCLLQFSPNTCIEELFVQCRPQLLM